MTEPPARSDRRPDPVPRRASTTHHTGPVTAPRPRRRLLVATALAAAALPALAGCTSGTSSDSPSPTAGTAAPGEASYASIAELQRALTAKGITCTLEYEGLKDDTGEKELSICVIDGEQAYLTIWLQPGLVEQFVASPDGQTGTVAVGRNWTVVVSTPGTAAKVAAALGGTVPTGAGTTTTRA